MKRTIITVILTLAFSAFAIQAVEQIAFSGAGVIESTTGGFKFPDGSVQLSATTPPCTAITEVPYIITNPGVYCFTGNLSTSMTSGNAITIAQHSVVIEMNGWELRGRSAGLATEANGIYAYQRKNITIRNGTVGGFYNGVWLSDDSPYTTSQGHLIEDIRADRNTGTGLLAQGRDLIVRRNHVVGTGGSTVSANSPATGIYLEGPAGRILENSVTNTVGTGTGYGAGVEVIHGDGVVVEGNRISGLTGDTTNYYGVVIEFSGGVLVKDNSIAYVQYGIYYAGAGSDGKNRDNLTSHVSTPFSGIGSYDAGGND